MSDEKPRIIVDDDWKEQVHREKEQIDQQEPDTDNMQMPEASFGLLITTLTTQSLSSLGFIPDPASGKAISNRPMAKHFIDTLAVLEEKTAGNLTDEEAQLLNESLHQLRMAYVAAGQAESESSGSGTEPTGSSIELP